MKLLGGSSDLSRTATLEGRPYRVANTKAVEFGFDVDAGKLIGSGRRLFQDADVIQIRKPDEPPGVVVVGRMLKIERRPARLVQEMMAAGMVLLDENVTERPKVGDIEHPPGMDVIDFSWADAPFGAAEPMLTDCHTVPRTNLSD